MPGFSKSKFAAQRQMIVSTRWEASDFCREIADCLALDHQARVLDIPIFVCLKLWKPH